MATPTALDAIADLWAQHGPVIFFQSGGCCGGSLPMCFEEGEFRIGDNDVLLGFVGGAPFYIDPRQYERWRHTQLIVDLAEGAPEGFSLSPAEDRYFVTKSRVFSSEELRALGDDVSLDR